MCHDPLHGSGDTREETAKQRLVALVDAEQKQALGKLSEATGLSQGGIIRRWLAYAIQQS